MGWSSIGNVKYFELSAGISQISVCVRACVCLQNNDIIIIIISTVYYAICN